MLKILFLMMFSLSALATIEVLNFKINPGKLHAGGKAAAKIESIDSAKGIMLAFLAYEVVKKPLVPVPDEYLKGTEKQELPLDFIDERGYLNLEAKGPLKLEDATVYHLGRTKIGSRTGVHHVKIVATNGRSMTEVFYHPEVPELGWVKVRLTLYTPIPLLKNYSIEAVLID
jgi:hypothetical protein